MGVVWGYGGYGGTMGEISYQTIYTFDHESIQHKSKIDIETFPKQEISRSFCLQGTDAEFAPEKIETSRNTVQNKFDNTRHFA